MRIQGGKEQAESSGSVEVTEKNWKDQVDGVSDKWRTGVKKTVRFGGASGIHEEKNDVESKKEKAVTMLSLSEQVQVGDVGVSGENGWKGKSSMSQLLEKLRRADDVFADPKVDNEVFDDNGVKATEKVVQKVESIFKKPHRAARKLTLKELECEDGDTSEKKEVFDDENQKKSMESLKVYKGEKKRVRLTNKREAKRRPRKKEKMAERRCGE